MAVITISRGTLSGGEALAEKLADRLSIPAISREVIREAASRYGIAENLLDQFYISAGRSQVHNIPGAPFNIAGTVRIDY